MTNDDLRKVLTRPGYGIQSAFKPAYGKSTNGLKAGSAGEIDDVEPAIGASQIRSEAVSLNYSGKCIVRIKFYRRRLADYSRAISEKALIDALVYGGALTGDSEKEICLIDEGQVKVESEKEERTEVILEYPEVDFDNLFVPRTNFGNAT